MLFTPLVELSPCVAVATVLPATAVIVVTPVVVAMVVISVVAGSAAAPPSFFDPDLLLHVSVAPRDPGFVAVAIAITAPLVISWHPSLY